MRRSKRFVIAIAALAATTFIPNGSRADLISVIASGPITFISESLTPSAWFALGDPITISATLDPALAVYDMFPDDPNVSLFTGQDTNTSPLIAFSIDHANYSFSISGLGTESYSDVSVQNDVVTPWDVRDGLGMRLQGLGDFEDFGQGRIDTNTFLSINAVLGLIQLSIADTSGQVFSDDSMPTSIDASQFDSATIMLGFYDNDTGALIGFVVSAAQVVPEPGTLGLFMTAGVLSLMARRRRHL
ncbi:MAG TPA: PEP-CTERM sorting domain-containing protein [Kiritimatiellia bacterium]|mgnify:FL=1|nr:PEP-CTERM sorting domain-containing protein [Kiritimatiellia bacterium]